MKYRVFMPVAFFGPEPEQAKPSDIWIMGVRYREVEQTDDPHHDWKRGYKPFPEMPK